MRPTCPPPRVSVLGCALACVSLLCLAGSVWGPGLIQSRVDAAVREQVVWQPDSPPEVQRRFAPGPGEGPPVHIRFYFFNITNLAGVHAGEKPVLEEVGPFTYLKVREKRGVEFSEDGRLVRFREGAYHVPCPELSAADPATAVVTTLNVPLAGALEEINAAVPSSAAAWLDVLAALVEGWRDGRVSGVFTSRPAADLLWGYTDPLLLQLARFVPGIEPTFRLVPNGTAGAAGAGAAEVDTGAADLREVWQYRRWRNLSAVTAWAPPHVEAVRGTDAFQFRPGLTLGDELEVWAGELYRAARVVAAEALPAAGGAPRLLRLRADPRQGDPDPRFYQRVRGLMNVSSPTAAGPGGRAGKAGAPIFLSHPHYCGADPALAGGVAGLACNPEQHELYLDVEPTTGITLRAAKRLMLSSWFGGRWAAVEPRARDTFLPIMWASESAEATEAQLRQFAPLLRAQAAAAGLAAWGAPLAGAAGLASLAVLMAAWVLAGQQQGGAWVEGDSDEEGGPGAAAPPAAAPAAAIEEASPPEERPLLLNDHGGEEIEPDPGPKL